MKIRVISGGQERIIDAVIGNTVLSALQDAGITEIEAPCGGKGSCGKCLVHIKGIGKAGYYLACREAAEEGMLISLSHEMKLTVAEGGSCEVYPPEYDGGAKYGVAADIGTTTVVCHLFNMETGRRIATVSGANPQRVFGADVISRIQASIEGRLPQMTQQIVSLLIGFVDELCVKAGIVKNEIGMAAIAGNTVMSHIFAGFSPDSIGAMPFEPISYFGEIMRIQGFCDRVYIAPAVSGYIGGDITAGILAAGLHKKNKPCLFIDIGTNGEMVLGCGSSFICCATAAGPAFEGAEIKMGMAAYAGAISSVSYKQRKLKTVVIGDEAPVGICGSGLIDALAVMLSLGAVDETGRLLDEDECEETALPFIGEERFYLTDDKKVYITQADIRKLQLAKAAIAAGIEVMLTEYSTTADNLDAMYIAGGFGSYISKESAARIGLFPPELLPKAKAIGNTAGEGAISALLSGTARMELEIIKNNCRYIELSTNSSFTQCFVEAMMFET